MIFKRILLIPFVLLLSTCVEKVTIVTFNFPEVTMKAFEPRSMELGEKNISHINKTQENDNISLVVAWEALSNTNDLKGINIYLRKDHGQRILIKEEKIESLSSLISKDLEYNVMLNFTMLLVNNSGEESLTSNSNTVSIFLSYGEPDKLEAIFDRVKTDSLIEFGLTWEDGFRGITNEVFNIKHQRNGILDSISINVEKETASDWEKIISIFGASREICTDDGESDKTRRYVINIARLKRSVKDGKIKVLKNYNKILFRQKNIDNLFSRKGKYRVSFYLYKNLNSVLNIHKTNFTEDIEIN